MSPEVALLSCAMKTPLGDDSRAVFAKLRAMEWPKGTAPIPYDAPPFAEYNRYLGRMGLFAMEVAADAVRGCGLEGGPRVGLFVGVGGLRASLSEIIHEMEQQREDGAGIWERGMKKVHPYWMLRHLSNNVHALASIKLGLRGDGATFGGGNGGAQAMVAAARALALDAIDTAVVVAYDSLLDPEALVELEARGELGRGVVPGEAAAALVLARADHPRGWARVSAFASCAKPAFEAGVDVAEPNTAMLGDLGAATAVVDTILMATLEREDGEQRDRVQLQRAAPGLWSAVRVRQ